MLYTYSSIENIKSSKNIDDVIDVHCVRRTGGEVIDISPGIQISFSGRYPAHDIL